MVQKSDRFQQLPTTGNNIQQGVQTDTFVTFNNAGGGWPTMLRPFARGLRGPYFTLVAQNIYRLINKLEADGVLISLAPTVPHPNPVSLSPSVLPFKGT